MKLKSNILILNQSEIIGGAELALKHFINDNDDFIFAILTDPKISTLYNGTRNISNIYTSNHFKKFPFKKLKDMIYIFSFIYSIIINLLIIHKIVKNNKIQLIYGNNSYDCILVSLYKILSPKLKTVQHIHDTLPEKSFLAKWIKIFKKRFDHILVPSTHTAAHLKLILGKESQISVVHNGINLIDASHTKNKSHTLHKLIPDNKKLIIATICRIDRNKRVDIFIDSLNELLNFRNDFTGIIIGESDDDDLLKSLQTRAAVMKLPVYFSGQLYHNEILNLYQDIDLLMINSDSETFSLVTIEAMQNKCVVLARRVGGINDIIIDNNNGFFYDYNADIKTIAEKINAILQMKNSEKEQIKKNAYMHVEKNFLNKHKVEKINKIFYEIDMK
ncbi:MAG: hypothetical protein CVV49_02565 [Spirochaetae bacterium HGW-Spirochaetae-5]|nr:MAG: hypothetical protein CVV49_02565 [Spirochaetae bacterium HGW-Spirochaetae-5]